MLNRRAFAFIGCAALTSACAKPPARPAPAPSPSPRPAPIAKRSRTSGTAWGIPSFFEVGREVRLHADSAPVDTTGWPSAILRAARRGPRAYLASAAEAQREVFVYPETDPSGEIHRFAVVLPEPRVFSTNGLATAYWGRDPVFMNFALEGARSFAGFVNVAGDGLRRSTTMRARLSSSGVNPQDLENVYELDGSHLAVLEHKGLVPSAPLSFLEYTVYDREATPDDAEPVAVDAASHAATLAVALTPLREDGFTSRRALEVNGYRVLLVTDRDQKSYFLAAPLELQPRWAFGGSSVELGPDMTTPSAAAQAGPGASASLLIPHPSRGTLLSGVTSDPARIGDLLERGTQFLAELAAAESALRHKNTEAYAVYAARALLVSHRSRRDPRALTQFAFGDAPQPANATVSSAAIRYGSDQASALRGLSAVYRMAPDPELRRSIAELAESSLQALTPSGATVSRRFDQMALAVEHDDADGRSDVFIDNGGAAATVNHRRLVLTSGLSRTEGVTWGALGFTVDGESRSVDDGSYAFGIDGTTLPGSVRPEQSELAVARLFTPAASGLRVRETAEVRRRMPAVSVHYRFENTSERAAALSEVRIKLGDFLEYGQSANERSQNRYGLGRNVAGVSLPIGFWMEGMPAPMWGDNFAAGELDVSEAYHHFNPRFLVVYGYDKAQVYALRRPADQLVLHNVRSEGGLGYNGFTALEARYRVDAMIEPHTAFELPEVLTSTLRAPLHSADGDAIPDQLQELAALWTQAMTGGASDGAPSDRAFETDRGHAGLVYSWVLAADTLAPREALLARNDGREASGDAAFSELAVQLRKAALRGARFALEVVNQLRNDRDRASTYANGNDYGFHLAIFDWAYQETCDPRYREAFFALADDLARSHLRNGLQVTDPKHPSYGGFLSTATTRANGVTSLDDQGVRLWALRIAYERTHAAKYRRAAELLLSNFLRLRAEDRLFTATVLADERFQDAAIPQGRTPLGHYALLSGLKAWADLSPPAQKLYNEGLEHATLRHGVHAVGWSGPYRMVLPREGAVDFGADTELGGWFLWALTLDPSSLRGRFVAPCRRRANAAPPNPGMP